MQVLPPPSKKKELDVLKDKIDIECKRVVKQVEPFMKRKISIFAAGVYARRFYKWFSGSYGKDVECLIDNNPSFAGQTVSGKPILLRPWESNYNFKDDYFVFISTRDDFAQQIACQLDECRIPYITSNAFQIAHCWDRYREIISTLADDFSRLSYLGALWYWLTGSKEYVQTVDHPYFALGDFMTCYNDIICDCGAFVGDTMEEYVKRGIGSSKIYEFEPNPQLHSKIQNRLARLQLEWDLSDNQVEIVMSGVGRENKIECFDILQGEAIRTEGGGSKLVICTIDEFFADKPKPTLIKADIEGMETDMLYGAEQTIRENKPKLAICLYHSPVDFYRIPEIVLELNPNYKLWVRNHSVVVNEAILYCVDDTINNFIKITRDS